MTMRSAIVAGFLVLAPSALSAQGITIQAGRLFDDGGWSAYGVSWTQRLLGPLGSG